MKFLLDDYLSFSDKRYFLILEIESEACTYKRWAGIHAILAPIQVIRCLKRFSFVNLIVCLIYFSRVILVLECRHHFLQH